MNILEVRKTFEEELRKVKYPDEEQKKRMEATRKALATDEGRRAFAKAWVEAEMTDTRTPKEREEKGDLMKAFRDDYLASSRCSSGCDKPKSWFDGKEL